ncbi:MAG: M23 family metallopeptidase [Henriciella sp.]|jgi:murein DD-endopeptidase MepM/ murein hydrolase activator NlpD
MTGLNKIAHFLRVTFPERQIYHRSGGTVRYFTVSSFQQIVLTSAALAISAWCLYATGRVLLSGSSAGLVANNGELHKLERWVQELRARDELSTSQLASRTEAFESAAQDLERRHQTLETMLNAFKNGDQLQVSALRGDGASLLVTASIDDADGRQPQRLTQTASTLPRVGLSGQVSTLRARQDALLDDIEDQAVERTEAARGVLRLTKVGENRIGNMENMGGPEITFATLTAGEFSSVEEAEFANRVAQVAARLEEARYFSELVETLPLQTPVGIPSRVTSNFGMRTDPIRKRPGWHGGIDMGAGWNAPIIAAGPGKVIFAGRKTGYGRVVDIDHGGGFVSRYAHLNRITTRRGNEVSVGDSLGTMGSSGRSTGPHLHYEILFHGKPYNPVEFIKAGKHVHQE